MNAGRDVERQISAWLTGEATDRSRDRVLAAVHQAVQRMPQRRFGAAWREPMYFSPARLAVMAAALVVAVVGGALIGRMTAPGGSGGPAPATSAPGPSEDELLAYRADRDAICNQYFAATEPLKEQLDGMYDSGLTEAELAAKVSALQQVRALLDAMTDELAELDAPDALAAAHAVAVSRSRDVNGLIDEVLRLIAEGDMAGAAAVDASTDALARSIEDFENSNGLAPCA